MSFTGDLEHLPIVDVVQLLHSTRKSGILRVMCHKGESQLVFKDGYFVSANHLNNRIKIGKILVDLKVITPEILEQALQAQKEAGSNQKPLIITLIDKGLVNEKDAYKGLEQLIEMTVVEILTWKKGTFTLDVLPETVTDEYIYYSGKLDGEIKIDTQRILMDALRIIDEKVRDGELVEEESTEEYEVLPEEAGYVDEGASLSLDDLGLADIDQLKSKVPEVFTVLEDRDPGKNLRMELDKIATDLPGQVREALALFFEEYPDSSTVPDKPAHQEGLAQSILFFSADELYKFSLTIVCKKAGILVFATNDQENLDPIIDQSLAKNSLPLLVLDAPDKSDDNFSSEKIAALRRQVKEKYPQISVIQLAAPVDHAFVLNSYSDGAIAVLPKPSRSSGSAETIRFLQAFQSYARRYAAEREISLTWELRKCIKALRGSRNAPDVASALLHFTARIFERSLTLIVRESELIAEKGIGIKAEKAQGSTPAMRFRIPLAKPSLLHNVITEGCVYYGKTDDAAVKVHLFAEIGAPASPSILLLPLKMRGKTISLTYGDFGESGPKTVDFALMEIVASQAELVMDNVVQQKRLEKPPVKG